MADVDVWIKYITMFDPVGWVERDKVTDSDLKKCMKEGKTVYELGIVDGPDPAYIQKIGDDGEIEYIGRA